MGYFKPSPYSFFDIMTKEPGKNYVYIADNSQKDFLSPNKLGWLSIGIKNAEHRIHKLVDVDESYRPQF